MRIANVLASYSLGEADLLRRAMGKKNAEAMAEQRDRFMTGAAALGHPKAAVGEIFDQMEKFSGYGFNKSHSAAYALVAYQTAYLKTHYPVEFMSALLTSEISKPENVVKYIKECRELGIAVEPPDVRYSDADFTPHGEAIRFGLTAIKNVGRNAIDSILAARAELAAEGKAFAGFQDFCEKIDLRLLNKRVIESLIKAGLWTPSDAAPNSSLPSTKSWSARKKRSAMSLRASPACSASLTPTPPPKVTISPTFPTWKKVNASPPRRKSSASLSPATRSTSTLRSFATCPAFSTSLPRSKPNPRRRTAVVARRPKTKSPSPASSSASSRQIQTLRRTLRPGRA